MPAVNLKLYFGANPYNPEVCVTDKTKDPMRHIDALDPTARTDLMRFLKTSSRPTGRWQQTDAEVLTESLNLLRARRAGSNLT